MIYGPRASRLGHKSKGKKLGLLLTYVMQASGVQGLEWRHLKNAPMEHIATQLVLDIVCCVQKVIGEVTT